MKDSYEISIWDESWASGEFVETKIGVIGSDSMTTECRAIEPKLVEDINGTSTFTFKMMTQYRDDNNVLRPNPWRDYLMNERKIKVKWRDKWYEFIIKNMVEDSTGKSVTYTCQDAFINELARNGYDLVYDEKLMNNQGTIRELVEGSSANNITGILEGTDWRYDPNSDTLRQEVEEALIVANSGNPFSGLAGVVVNKSIGANTYTLTATDQVMFYYSTVASLSEQPSSNGTIEYFQFFIVPNISGESDIEVEENGMLVTNGECVYIENMSYSVAANGNITFSFGATSKIVSVTNVSKKYRANRYVRSQRSVYDPFLKRYTLVYKTTAAPPSDSLNPYKGQYVQNQELHVYSTTDYPTVVNVPNLLTNSQNFTDHEGWRLNRSVNISVKRGNQLNEDGYFAVSRYTILLEEDANIILYNQDSTQSYTIQPEDKNKSIQQVFINADVKCNDINFYNRHMPTILCPNINSTISSGYLVNSNNKWVLGHPTIFNKGIERSSNILKEGFKVGQKYIARAAFYLSEGSSENSTPRPYTNATTGSYTVINARYINGPVAYKPNQDVTETSPTDVVPTQLSIKVNKDATAQDVTGIQTRRIIFPVVTNYDINGEQYIISSGALSDNYISCRYTKDDGTTSLHYYVNTQDDFTYHVGQAQRKQDDNDKNLYWYEWEMECRKPCTWKDFTTKQIGLFFVVEGDIDTTQHRAIEFQAVQFFPKETDKAGNIIYPATITNEETRHKVSNVLFNYTRAKNHSSDVDFNIENYIIYHDENLPSNDVNTGIAMEPVWNSDMQEIRSITGSKSNRFNLLQSCAETFKCWVRFDIKHDTNGYVEKDAQGLKKFVTFKREIGEVTGLDFEYGIDLKSIQRTIKSDQITTKTIVQPNHNEFAPNGMCSIAQSTQNPTRDTFILNFDYYINRGMIDKDKLWLDLYSNSSINYVNALRNNNTQYDALSQQLTGWRRKYEVAEAQYETYSKLETGYMNEISTLKKDIVTMAKGKTFDDSTTKTYIKDHYDPKDSTTPNSIYVKLETITNDEYELHLATIASAQAETAMNAAKTRIDEIVTEMAQIESALRNLHLTFFKKYQRFIQEGTWTDEKYVNPDLYYIDAEQVSYTSSRPQVSYNISVLRLSSLEEFKSKVFHLGDICGVRDKEFFGTTDAGKEIKEKVIISQLTSYFDEPAKDQITVQNYKTQFEDLFHRVSAATQNLTYASGDYAKITKVVDEEGYVTPEAIQAAYDNSNTILTQSSLNNKVEVNDAGITITQMNDNARRVRITSDGIFVTRKGDDGWTNAVHAEGIATELLTAGQIKTGQIDIYDGQHQSFRWDRKGITAYTYDNDTPLNENQFIRFDQFGIYGAKTTDKNWMATTEAQIWGENCPGTFGMTWNKMWMKAENKDGSGLYISSNPSEMLYITKNIGTTSSPNIVDTFRVDSNGNVTMSGTIKAAAGNIAGWTVTTSQLINISTTPTTLELDGVTYENVYLGAYVSAWHTRPTDGGKELGAFGVRYYTNSAGTVATAYPFYVRYDGYLVARKANITGSISATAGYIGAGSDNTKKIQIQSNAAKSAAIYYGIDSMDSTSVKPGFYLGTDGLRLGTKFKVTSDGKLTASDGSFSGTVTANSGKIGNWNLSSDMLWSISTVSAEYNSQGTTVTAWPQAFMQSFNTGTSTDRIAFGIRTRNATNTDNIPINGRSYQFSVNYAGKLYAQNAEIEGKITANSLTLGTGVSIDADKINNTATKSFYWLGGTIGTVASTGSTGFTVSTNGLLEASNAVIYGTIYASAGKIGGCSITGGTLYVKNANISGKLEADKLDVTNLIFDNSNGGALSVNNILLGKTGVGPNTYYAVRYNGTDANFHIAATARDLYLWAGANRTIYVGLNWSDVTKARGLKLQDTDTTVYVHQSTTYGSITLSTSASVTGYSQLGRLLYTN